jgi:hypothetical protein
MTFGEMSHRRLVVAMKLAWWKSSPKGKGLDDV